MAAPRGYFFGEFAIGAKKRQCYKANGEFRPPKKGEYYLSGAEITVYHALNDLTDRFWIAVAVEMMPCPHCAGKGEVERPVPAVVSAKLPEDFRTYSGRRSF